LTQKDPQDYQDNHLSTVAEALEYCARQLESADVFYGHGTDNAWDEAVQLVLFHANIPLDSDHSVVDTSITPEVSRRIGETLTRRIESRTPLPYLLGVAHFAGIEFKCDERAIIPRSPIAELILNQFQPWYTGPEPKRALDMCCGGGSIGLALAHLYPGVRVDLLDIDGQALSLAAENSERLGLTDRVRLLKSSGLDALGEEKYDLILCNPPYVDATELAAMPAEYHAEPEISLASGADGLDFTRQFLAQVGQHLEPRGLLILEVGASWPALEDAYPQVPFTWVELAQGGEGIFVMSAQEWQDYSESFLQ
jgi:ribosomal protein L3 glutamine methyltransferase